MDTASYYMRIVFCWYFKTRFLAQIHAKLCVMQQRLLKYFNSAPIISSAHAFGIKKVNISWTVILCCCHSGNSRNRSSEYNQVIYILLGTDNREETQRWRSSRWSTTKNKEEYFKQIWNLETKNEFKTCVVTKIVSNFSCFMNVAQ